MKIKVSELKSGDCFRKKTGEFGYIKMSESSIKLLGLNADQVYGLTSNGNVTKVEPDTIVLKVPDRIFFVAKAQQIEFDRTFSK